jgi:tetratricopeptide (TPR) repeat protein
MRLYRIFATFAVAAMEFGVHHLDAQTLTGDAWKLEAKGDAAEAREQLQKAADAAPNNPLALEAYAEFLGQHRDPAARAAYEKLWQLLSRNGANPAERAKAARRLTELDLLAGDRESAEKHLQAFRSAGGSGLSLPAASVAPRFNYIEIPGPLRSFARMAAISPDIAPEDVMASVAHNVTLNGYSASRASESLEPTEYLKLVIRYLSQARELEKLAGAEKMLRVDMCESTVTGDLLRILGYRMRGGCGSDVALETVNPSRAFLTIDSGFPLSDLEAALRTNRPFSLDFHPSRVPILYGPEYWQPAVAGQKPVEFIDFFLGDPSICRLYTATAALDPDTAEQLRKDLPAAKAKIYAHVLDFFGSMFEVRDGKAIVPGGARSEKMWAELVGVAPDKGAAFFERLIEKDDGWLASYYDSLARINGPVEVYLTEPERLKRFYLAMRGKVTSPGPARPVFRANTDMVLLTTRLRMDADGKPHLPGGLDTWKNLFAGKAQAKYDQRLAKAAPGWKDSEEVIEAMFGLSRKIVENEALKIFMALTDIERNRAKPLDTNTVDRLVRDYKALGAQYPLFAEAPAISDATIVSYLDAANGVTQIRDIALRADAAGTLQALAGFWQVFVRQRSIPPAEADGALGGVLQGFAKVQSQKDVFDAGQKGLAKLLEAAHAPSTGSPQDHIMDLLAGTKAAGDVALSDAHTQMIQDMTRVFEAQRLVSLDTILTLADRLEAAAAGQKLDSATVVRLAGRITEIQLPRTALNTRERTEASSGYWTDKHIEAERKLNLRAAIDKAGADPQKLREVRAALAPVLRDTLVGLNYVHYAPPGAQVLFTNSAFVRSHDFYGSPDHQRTWLATEVLGSGWPSNAGGRLVGSLIALPYALADAEQNFLIPSREQALIWGDLVPQMILTAVIPRWWNVTPTQLHWVGLNMAYAESALAQSSLNEAERQRVVAVLDHYVPPSRLKKIERMLAEGDVRRAAENVVPSEMYLVARDLAPNDHDSALAEDLRRLAAEAPEELDPRTISHAFGTPKPLLSTSYEPALLNLRTFPTLMGYSSRMLAESWESNLLFYAALADEVHMRPAELNLRVPEWTQQTVERIFATHLEDWPALLRSLRLVGDDVRQKARKQMVAQNQKTE